MDCSQLTGMNIHYRYYSLETFFQSVSKNGLSTIELWLCPQHFYINNNYFENIDSLKYLCNKYEQSLHCICPEQNNPKPNNIAAKGNILIENTISYYKNVFHVAQQMNCHKVLVTPGWNYYDESLDEARIRSIKMLQLLCDLASEKQIDLVLESIWAKSSQIASTIGEINYLKENVDRKNLLLTLDLGAMAAANESIEQWFKAFGSSIAHCHFVDGSPTGHTSWGRGTRNMFNDLNTFEKFSYKGKLSFEFVDPKCYKDPYLEDRTTIELFNDNLRKRGLLND